MYDLMPFILGGAIFILGLIMAICPRMTTKKEYRDFPNKVKRIRIGGIVLCITGIFMIVSMGIMRYIE